MNGVNSQLIERLVAGYGLSLANMRPPQKGYRNQSYPIILSDGRTVNLILHKAEPNALALIRRANDVSSYLHRKGFPCRIMIGPIAKFSSVRVTKYAALYTYLPGETIPWEAYTMRHIKLAGKILGTMHETLATFSSKLPDIIEANIELNSRMLRYFADPAVAHALDAKLGLRVQHADFRPLLYASRQLPNRQALHMDFVRGNILFAGKGDSLRISGILDFEKTAHGPVLFDIARTLAFLLVDCKYKPANKVWKYFLHSGYRKQTGRFAYTSTNKRVLQELVSFNLLHDFYKFLRHNPYEYLPQNEHFVRTRNLLQARNIIE